MRNAHVDNPKQSLTTLSLCTGYGGIERGLELTGEQLNVLAHVEIEAFAIANLVAKMEEGKLAPSPIWSNLKTLPVEPFRDRVDLITGGYPCQPFSAAGKRAGKDDPRHLWPYISDIIRAVRPVRCFFENVEGHISLGLREVISDLESLGYKTTWGIFSAAEVGAPHQRKRVYILADSQSQRHGSWGGQRDLHKADGGQIRECLSKPPITSESEGTELSDSLANSISAAARDNSGTSTDKGRGPSAVGSASLRQAHGEELPVRAGAASANSTAELGYSQHDGLSVSEVTGITPATGNNSTKGENASCESKGASKPCGSRDIRNKQVSGNERWLPEPNVGRMVDGCANRVDRIRLLGNGVVPQTAAKAWITLNEEFNNED